MINQIIKRDGTVELFNPDKLNKWAEWASNINGVEWSSIALDAVKKCYDKCTTSDLQAAMIMACIDRADEAHLYMAGRLYAGDTYKIVFGDHTSIPSLKEMYYGMIAKGLWANMNYSDEELDELNSVIDHSKDLRCIHSELKQIREKYSINDKVSGKCYETPQFMYMRVALASMNNQPADRRINDVKKVYTYLSDKKLNAPSPYMLHLGTPHRGLASCCVFASDDNIPSLAVGDHIAYMMTCASAGIGGTIFTRSKGDPVRGGTIEHMGKLPYLRVIEKGVNANVQAGRGGAATIYFNGLDPEISDLLRLRNPKTVAEKRIKDIDYGFSYNRYFLEKVARNEQWMLISYHYAKDLWDAMYSPNQSLFIELYQKYLADETVPKELVSARDIAILFLTNSYEVGRFYEFAIDHVNTHTPFKDRINSSNLCAEIALPTKPFTGMMDLYSTTPDGEIGLCNLMAIVAGRVAPYEYEDVAYYALLIIDNVIDIMEYPFPSLETTAKSRRSAGVGITNIAYDMAYKGLWYDSQSGKDYIHRLAEMHSYWLHKASLRLSKEKGVCDGMSSSKYPDGWLPIDTYCRHVDVITQQKNCFDWESLRVDIVDNGGIRNSVLEAYMPCESSSGASNTANGPYPIREGIVIKTDNDNKRVFIAPHWEELKNQYQFAHDVPTKDMIEFYAILQKWCGQSISADLYHKYSSKGDERKIDTKTLINDLLYRHKCGMKTRYYINTSSGIGINTESDSGGCASGACKM